MRVHADTWAATLYEHVRAHAHRTSTGGRGPFLVSALPPLPLSLLVDTRTGLSYLTRLERGGNILSPKKAFTVEGGGWVSSFEVESELP